MKSVLFDILIFLTVLISAGSSHFGQATEVQKDQPGKMFVGEKLVYDGKFNKYKISFSVAELTFTSEMAANGTDLVINGEALSKGTLTKIARFSFTQQYRSVVDLNLFRALKTTKHDVQKERIRDGEAIFDYGQKRVSYVETDPKDANRPPRRIASEIGAEVQDITSAIYSLRLMPLTVGKRFEMLISDSGIVYKVPVVIAAREKMDTVLGKVWCFRVEPEVFGPGRLMEQSGRMTIWLTDDARRIPVRGSISATIGKIDIKLKTATPAK